MEPKIKSLVENLLVKTKKRQTNWERFGSSDRFILFLENAKVTIEKLISNKGNLIYQFSIINDNGDNILTISKSRTPETFLPTEEYDLLKELHEEVKKAYFKVDETIEGLLGEIDKEGEIGKDDPNPLPF
jgi:hypothetical protein